jgi:hypothetical protein
MCSDVHLLAPNDLRVKIRFSPSELDLMLQPAPSPTFTGGWYNTSFTLPSAFFKQLAQRQQAYPIPWNARDKIASWLAPSRLILHPFVGKSGAADLPRMFIDGSEVPLIAAFNSRGMHFLLYPSVSAVLAIF